ncbi:AtpZ/AtpI family protein, partial [Bacillus cereus group sp. N8]|uniref:AtpZ/AtpI family protein n=1 Tax=Bacillus cereus group sp. N8 TaxID=2794584 RepID=UPI0018F3023C
MQKNARSHIKAYALMSGILAQLVGSIIIGIFGGQWIDNNVGTFQLFHIIGLLLGLGT